MKKTSRTFRAGFLLDGTEVSCDIKKIIITRGACGSETFSPGGVFSSYIEATVDELEESLENRELLLQMGLVLDDGAVEYIDMGYYTVTKPKSTAYQTVFTAVGRITSKLNCLFETRDMSLSGIAAAITSITGVPIVFNGLTATGTVEADMTGLTCKEALEVIASVLGGFATEDNTGNIVISRFSAADPIPYNGERMTELPAFNDYDYNITGVKVITAEAGEDEDGNEIPEVAYSAGAPRLIIANQYMTESLFDIFAENLMGYSYRPGTVPLALGDPRIDPWDCLSITDVKGNVYVVPCLSIVHTFDGGISTMITAPGDSETEGQTQTAGPLTKMIGRINADLFTAQQAIIKRLKADEAELLYAKVADLDAVNATIEGLIVGELTAGSMQVVTGYVDHLTANKADINFANVDAAKIEQAWINDLLVQGSIITENINAATGSFSQYLTGVNIVGDIITAGTIATDRLLIRDPDTNEGILFAINNGIVSQEGLSEEALKRLTLNGQVITAESITADKIHVTDLSAFGATIGGFNITEDSLYSGAKNAVANTTRGIYLDTDGQIAFGDASSFVKYYKAEDGTYKLDISATNINFGFDGEGGGIRPREEESGETVIVIENNTTIEGDTTIIGGTSIEGDTSISGSTTLADEDTSFSIKSDGVSIESALISMVGGVFITGDVAIDGELLLDPALAIANGGTGATTVAGVLANLGLDGSAGSATQPIYFKDGKPVKTTYSLNKTVPADAKFTDTTYEVATTSAAGLMSTTMVAKLNGIAAGAQVNSVTGVKGNAESSYRTGKINLTPANIGAAASSHAHSRLENDGKALVAFSGTYSGMDAIFFRGALADDLSLGIIACLGSPSWPFDHVYTEHLNVYTGRVTCPPSYNNTVSYATNMYVNSGGIYSRTTNTSSKNIKHDIKPLEDGELCAEKLYDVGVYQFKYNEGIITDEEDPRYMKDLPGLIIEDLYEKYPIAVDAPSDDVKEWSWNAQYLIPPMLKLIQEQKKKLDEQDRLLSQLKERMDFYEQQKTLN